MTNILTAFDPGGTTGFAVVNLTTYEVIERGQFKDWRAVVPDLIRDYPCDVIAYESFILRRGAHTSDQIDPVYVIGAIEAWAEWEGIPTAHYPPSTTKQVTDEVLERLGWLVTPKTPNRHANDALRVAACYLREVQDMKFIERAWPK